MDLVGDNVTVGTSPTLVYQFTPSQLNAVGFKALADLTIGSRSVTPTNGLVLAAGEAWGFNHDDFSRAYPYRGVVHQIYAVAAVETKVRIFSWKW